MGMRMGVSENIRGQDQRDSRNVDHEFEDPFLSFELFGHHFGRAHVDKHAY